MSQSVPYKLRSDVRYRMVEDQAVVIRQSEGEVLVLNEIGGSILRQIENTASLQEILLELTRSYEAPQAEVETDLLAFLVEMVEAGVLESTQP